MLWVLPVGLPRDILVAPGYRAIQQIGFTARGRNDGQIPYPFQHRPWGWLGNNATKVDRVGRVDIEKLSKRSEYSDAVK